MPINTEAAELNVVGMRRFSGGAFWLLYAGMDND
jgi:hypothetical protein